jgi:uncharacterized membrane protein YkoI
MKALLLLFAAVLITSSNAFSKSTSPNSPGIVSIQEATLSPEDTIPVPATIRTAFATKYPNATSVKWYRYNPGTMKVEPGMWYSTLDPSDYYVSFVWEDADYVAWYDNGAWIHSSRKIDNTQLPDVVSRIITTEYPGYIVTDVDHEMDKGQSLYEVDLEKADQKWVLHINEAGAIVKKKQRNVSRAEPETVMVTDFETRYPNATAVTWYKFSPREPVEILPSDWDYNLDASDYEVRFVGSDGSEYVAWYDNGTWVRGEAYTFDASKLPSAVSQAINKDFNGYMIKDVDREDNTSRVVYEVELEKGVDKCKIHYAADGSIVKKKCRLEGVKTKSKS